MRKIGYEYIIHDVPGMVEPPPPPPPPVPKMEEIKRVVMRHYKLKPGDLESPCRKREFAHPRQIALYLCRHLTPSSYPMIGRSFGNRDHTTVLFSYRKVAHFCANDSIWAEEMKRLEEMIQKEVDARPPIPRWSYGAEFEAPERLLATI